MAAPTFELPPGIEHGTPEGFAAGCKKERGCPALLTHGMCCQFAHVRAMTDPRYYKAKTRDPRPAAIAARLGIRPPQPAAVAWESSVDEKFAEKPPQFRYDDRHDLKVAAADQTPVKQPVSRDSASSPTDPADDRTSTRSETAAIEQEAPTDEVTPTGHITTEEITMPTKKPKREVTHGTTTMYGRGCRDHCPGHPETGITCRQAAVDRARELKQAKALKPVNENATMAERSEVLDETRDRLDESSTVDDALDETPLLTPEALAEEIRRRTISAGPFPSLASAAAYEINLREAAGLARTFTTPLDGLLWSGELSLYWAVVKGERPYGDAIAAQFTAADAAAAEITKLIGEGRQLASQRDDLIAAGANADDLVVPNAPIDIVARTFQEERDRARDLAAHLEEENAQLTATTAAANAYALENEDKLAAALAAAAQQRNRIERLEGDLEAAIATASEANSRSITADSTNDAIRAELATAHQALTFVLAQHAAERARREDLEREIAIANRSVVGRDLAIARLSHALRVARASIDWHRTRAALERDRQQAALDELTTTAQRLRADAALPWWRRR